MTRTFALLLLAASLLTGCGTSPFAPQMTSANEGAASAAAATGKVQIFNAIKRVDATSMRVVVMYWVRKEAGNREFRQLIIDTVPTQDRSIGHRPTQLVLNGNSVFQSSTGLQKIASELGELAYHTTTKEQQQIVALAYELIADQLR